MEDVADGRVYSLVEEIDRNADLRCIGRVKIALIIAFNLQRRLTEFDLRRQNKILRNELAPEIVIFIIRFRAAFERALDDA